MMELAEMSMLANDVLASPPRGPDAGDQIAELTTALAGRDSFVAFVGHELRDARGPLVLLADQFAALAEDPLTLPMVASRAAMLTRNLRRYVATIDGVADVAGLRHGVLHLERAPVDLVEVCRELAGEAAGLAELLPR